MTKLLRKLFPNLFKWKVRPYEPVNSFETALRDANQDPGARPELLRKMFHFDVFVMGQVETGPDSKPRTGFEKFTKPAPYPHVRAYTSQEAYGYFFNLIQQEPRTCVKISLFRLFSLSKGEFGVVVNLGLPFGVQFSPDEIRNILADQESLAEQRSTQAGQTYQIGIPASIPRGLPDALRTYGSKNANCKNIYLGLMTHPDESLSYVIAIELLNEIRSSRPPTELADLQVITEGFQFEYPVGLCEAKGFILDCAHAGHMLASFPDRL